MIRIELYHAMLVHFPIALLVVSYVFFIASIIFKNETFLKVSLWNLALGAAGAVVAVATGLLSDNILQTLPHSDAAHDLLEAYHKPLGLAVMGVALALTAWSLILRWKFSKVMAILFAAIFTFTIALLALTGHYGAVMVYEHGMCVSPKVLSQEMGRHHLHGEAEEGEEAGHNHEDAAGAVENEKNEKDNHEDENEHEHEHEHQHDEAEPAH